MFSIAVVPFLGEPSESRQSTGCGLEWKLASAPPCCGNNRPPGHSHKERVADVNFRTMSNMTNKPAFMCFVDQFAQFFIGMVRILGEAWFGAQEVVNAIAMIGSGFASQIAKRRAQPDRTHSQFLQILQLFFTPAKGPTRESSRIWDRSNLAFGARRRLVKRSSIRK